MAISLEGQAFTVSQLAEARARRISLGSTLWRATSGALLRAAREMREQGTFAFTAEAMPFADANALMNPTPRA